MKQDISNETTTMQNRPLSAHRQTVLKRTRRGDYVRNLGFLPNGTQPKFRLGFERTEALRRLEAIVVLWESVSERPRAVRSDGQPAWDAGRLAAARDLATGKSP